MSVKLKLLNHVKNEIRRFGRRQKPRKDVGVFVCCPFHKERTPSCHVTFNHPKYWPGSFHCLGCGESGGWNAFAEKANLLTFKFDKKERAEDDPFFELSESLNYELEAAEKKDSIKLPKDIEQWSKQDGYWRGLGPNYLKALGAYKWFDDFSNTNRLLLPAYMNGKLRGYVGARIKDTDTDLRYRNAAGEWAKTTWLGYDYHKYRALEKAWAAFDYKSVAIVEGPYDLARCVYHGIPTLSMLGVENYNDIKKASLLSLGIKKVVTFTDGDRAGVLAAQRIVADLRDYVQVSSVKLPVYKEKDKQLDPGNCPKKYYDMVKESLCKY